MNSRVNFIYQLLLLTSIISSGILFIIVAAEHGINIASLSSQENDGLKQEDLENLDSENTVDQKPVDYDSTPFEKLKDEERQLDQRIRSSFEDTPSEDTISMKEQPLDPESGSLFQNHASVTDEFSETGHAVVFTLVDSASQELQKAAVSSLLSSDDADNETTSTAQQVSGPVTVPLPLQSDAAASNDSDELYVVRAEPKQVVVDVTQHAQVDASHDRPSPPAEEAPTSLNTEDSTPPDKASNETAAATNITADLQSTSHEEIPSFSEWAQKQLAEAEKKKAENKTSGNVIKRGIKQRSKNYASTDCGAKVVSTNPEASSVWAVLSSSRDEYLLNSCTNKIWFVVELCEAIQIEKIELANFELFSSILREFSVSVSDRLPTREWTQLGQFEAKEVRLVQSFTLKPTSAFFKYIRVEFHSHYGAEHYCPVSLFRVYGTSEFEVLDTVDEAHSASHSLEEDEDELEGEGERESVDKPRNLFSSARDAVLSIVKRAAQVLVKSDGQEGASLPATLDTTHSPFCQTPAYIIVCDNCSDPLFNSVHELLSCHSKELETILESNFTRSMVSKSEECKLRGLDMRGNVNSGAPFPMLARTTPAVQSQPSHYLETMLPNKAVIALCNLLAIARKQVVLNITYDLANENLNATQVTSDAPVLISSPPSSTCTLNSSTSPLASSSADDSQPVEGTKQADSQPASTASASHIKPTKTFLTDDLHSLPLNDESTSSNTTDQVDNQNQTVVDSVPMLTASQPIKVPSEDKTATASDNLISDESILEFPEEAVASTGDGLTFDSLFSELDEVESDPSTPATTSQPTILSPPQTLQRESVFLRLAKRIKALERNMSLSGQYLEELSRRYKRQVEEMQRALSEVVEERRRHDEKEERRSQQVAQLSEQVLKLTITVEALIEERNSWAIKHGAVIIVEVVVFGVILLLCRWLPVDVDVGRTRFSVGWPKQSFMSMTSAKPRRSSIDGSLARGYPRLRKRRPSEEALRISGSTHQDLLIPDASRKNSRAENRRRRRKKKEQAQATFYVDDVIVDGEGTRSIKSDEERRQMPPPPPPLPLPPPAHAPPPVLVVKPVLSKEQRRYIVPVPEAATPLSVPAPPPNYVQTALSVRKKRNSLRGQSSSELSDSASNTKLNSSFSSAGSPSLLAKKSGPLKKIMKKFF